MYGSRIKYHRERCKMFQSDLGRLLGVSAQAVSKWELDKSEPDGENIRKMCEIFHIDANELMGIAKMPPIQDDRKETDEKEKLMEELRNVVKRLSPEKRSYLLAMARFLEVDVSQKS